MNKKKFLLLIIFILSVFLAKSQDEDLTYSNALARACVEKADKYVEKGNFVAALRWMNKAIKRNPKQAELYYNRGVIYRLTGDFELALSDFNETIQLRPDLGRAFLNKGMTLHELGKLTEAIEAYNIAADSLQVVAEVYALKGKAQARIGKHALAAISYQQALALESNNPNWRLERAEALRKTGAYAAARAETDNVIRKDSSYGEAWIVRGRAQLEQGLPYEALLDAKKAEAVGADKVEVRVLKGDIHLVMGQVSTAATLYEGAIATNPDDAEGFYRRGRLNLLQEKNKPAVRDLLQAVRLDSGISLYRVALGEALEASGDPEGAMYQYNRAANIDPESRLVAKFRGTLRAQLGDFDAALADIDHLVNTRHNDMEALRLRASVRQQAGQLKASLKDLEKIMKIDSSHAQDWASLGYVHSLLNNSELATQSLSKAKKADPTYGLTYVYLGAHAIMSEDIMEAEDYLDRGISLNPEEALGYFWRAYWRSMSGKPDGACEDLSKARNLGMTDQHMPQPLSLQCQ